jgi:hypothetical protein
VIKASVAYVLCRIEDDSSLTPISGHEDVVAAVAAGKHQVEVEDFDFSYALYADGVKSRWRPSLRAGSVIVNGRSGAGG